MWAIIELQHEFPAASKDTGNTAPTICCKASCCCARRSARTKSLLASDGEIIAQIYKERVIKRGYGSGSWARLTAYHEGIAV